MIELLGWINGGTFLLLVAGIGLYGWWYLAIAEPEDNAYNPTTEGETMPKLRPLPCQVKGCKGFRSHSHLVCPSCWRRVPKHLRDDVYRQWDLFSRGSGNGYLRWLTARQKCLESVREVQTL